MKKLLIGLMILSGVVFAENKIYVTAIVEDNDSKTLTTHITLSSNELNKEDMERLNEIFKKAQEEFKTNKIVLTIENKSQQ